jgi:hypothetical protein
MRWMNSRKLDEAGKSLHAARSRRRTASLRMGLVHYGVLAELFNRVELSNEMY